MGLLTVVFLATLALASATPSTSKEDLDYLKIDKISFVNEDVTLKQKVIVKLLNHILEPTIYKDVKNIARDFKLEDNIEQFTKTEVIKDFLRHYNDKMLPRGEIFSLLNEEQMKEVIRVFHVLFYAKDFDTFIKTACWMRERINEGMFVYALTVAVLHREDCRGIVLPAPYEIYPYFFVNSDVIQKAYMLKMKRGALDKKLHDYYGIRVKDNNVFLIDSMDKDLRIKMNLHDKLKYFTEDIDLNTYYYYFHMDYPLWMGDDVFGVNKDRRGELYYFVHQQLLARYNLERLSHKMCDVKMLSWWLPIKKGYWPMLRYHNGVDMPLRLNNVKVMRDENVHLMTLVDDYETRIREALIKGYVVTRDGTRIDLKKSEDIETLGRLVHGNLDKKDVLFYRYLELLCKTLLGVDAKNVDKYRLTPTVVEQFETALRDPVFWKLMRRIVDNFIVFKKMLPAYTREDLHFPGVKIDNVVTDKLVTFYDTYDIDITNAVMLDNEEVEKQREDMVFLTRKLRLNHKPFEVTVDVLSDKTVDCVIRIFLGPKKDCMDNLVDLNDRRLDFVEIDTFSHELTTGKNVIKRDSKTMHNVITDRILTRNRWDTKQTDTTDFVTLRNSDYWYKTRVGFPHRLLLPKGHKGGLEMQLYVVVTPVKMDRILPIIKIEDMKTRHVCRSSVCFDTMPLGFPFDRDIDMVNFYTPNMKFTDVLIFHREVDELRNIDYRMKDKEGKFKDYKKVTSEEN